MRPVLWRGMRLRCQGKNMARLPAETWSRPPRFPARVEILYTLSTLRRSIVAEMEARAKVRVPDKSFRFDLPDFGPPPLSPPYAVVRPASMRTEWRNTARNPDPAYLVEAATELKRQGYRVVVVGDLDGVQETLVGTLPPGDVYRIRGELSTRQLFALIRHATLTVGGVGWIVPTCLAYRTPSVVIGGGLGGHNAPALLVDPRMDAARMRFLLPDPYCACRNPRHECRKVIPDFLSRFRAALSEVLC